MTPAMAHAARKLLAREASERSTSKQVAAGAVGVCNKLTQHLSRLVGDAGIRALFDRSLILTRVEFPWLAGSEDTSFDPSWGQLQACMEGQEADAVIEASVSLVTTFLAITGRLIGDALVLRQLGEVWPDVFPPTPKEPT